MSRVIKPPTSLDAAEGLPSVFLAGSIEMGRAENWQSSVEEALRPDDVVVLNPRRDEWDDSWAQTIVNPRFREQVEWELAGQEMATVIAMYFAPETKAPITLLELGLFAHSGKLIAAVRTGTGAKATSMWSATGTASREWTRWIS